MSRLVFPEIFDAHFPDLFAYPTSTQRLEDNAVVITLEVPGYSDQDIKVQAEPGYLIISGDLEGRKFRKAYTLPNKIDLDGITASAKHGLLTIKMPFIKASQPRQIQVN